MIPKGTIFHGPDGMGYEMTRDVHWGTPMSASDIKPVGGAPDPIVGKAPPLWLLMGIMEYAHEQSQKD